MYQKIEINNKNPYINLLVYGTLRVGHGNWTYLLENRSKHLGTIKTTPEYTMYNAGGFPIVSKNGNTSIECDVIQVQVQGVLDRIFQLEGFTGEIGNPRNWYDVEKIEHPEYGTCYMFVQNNENLDNLKVISSGNWKIK